MRVWPPVILLLLGLALSSWSRPRNKPPPSLHSQQDPSPGQETAPPTRNLGSTRPRHGENAGQDEAAPTTCEPCRCHQEVRDFIADCSGLRLRSIPTSVPDNITSLLFNDNDLDTKDGTFLRFRRLRLLDISANGIQSMSAGFFGGLDSLEELLLERNKLRYSRDIFKPEIFAPLVRLRHLTLHGNTANMQADLDYPDVALSQAPLLENLTLDGLTNRSFGPGLHRLRNLTLLSLSGLNSQGFCQLDTLTNDTFVHVPFIKTINISKCDLRVIVSGAFIPLQQIDTIDISMNEMLGFDNLERASYGFQNRTIRLLKVSSLYSPYTSCVIVRRNQFQYLRHVKEIHINYNRIQTFELGALSQLANDVEVMYAQGNLFEGPDLLLEVSTMKKLHTADISYRWNMIEYKDDEVASPFQLYDYTFNSTQTLVMDHCEATSRSQALHTTRALYFQHLRTRPSMGSSAFPVPPNLRVLRLRDKGYLFRIWKTEIMANNIEEIDLSGNLMQHWAGPVYGLNTLKILNLSRNYAYLLKSTFTYNVPSLEEADFSYNLLGDQVANRTTVLGFDNLTALRKLHLSNNGLYLLPKQISIASGTLEELRLSHNLLTAQGLEIDLTNYTKLRYIDLSSNSLDRLTPNTTSALDGLAKRDNSSLRVDLSKNPVSCVCGNLDFLLWLRSTRVVLVSREELTCVKEDGSTVGVWAALEELEPRCRERLGLFMGSALGSLAMVAVLVGLVIYRYRWKLRYWFYLARARYRHDQGAQVHFRYDAFISYASEDYEWVRGQLQQRLERDHGLRLCIHQRDFLPGTPIAANVVEAVQTSRRTVCVLSENFLDSYWCTYEMQMAKMEGLHTGRDVVLLLLYDHTIKRALPREIVYYIQSESYLENPQHQDAMATFWNNLVLALQRP